MIYYQNPRICIDFQIFYPAFKLIQDKEKNAFVTPSFQIIHKNEEVICIYWFQIHLDWHAIWDI